MVSTTVLPVTVTLNYYTNRAGSTLSSALTTGTLPPPQVLTWEFHGVTLTYPTVYAAYETFSHVKVEPIFTSCVSQTTTLDLPQPTNYAALVMPENDITDHAVVPPRIVSYLNAQPTVVQQLGRSIGAGACDPIVGSTTTGDTSTLGSTTYVETRSAADQTITQHIPAEEAQQTATTVQSESAPPQQTLTSTRRASTPTPTVVVETQTPVPGTTCLPISTDLSYDG